MKTLHHTDHLSGSNIDTDETGKVVEMADYYPFGALRLDHTTTAYRNPYKFTGKELDTDSGLYYYSARYYDPQIGRFVSQDSWEGDLKDPQSLNRYSYVRNNPLRYIDPTGMTFIERMEGFFGGLGDAALGTVNAIAHPIDTITSTTEGLYNNAKYLYDYGSNHSTSEFFSDLQEGIEIKVDEFNQMSEYDKGHVIGGVTEKVFEAAIVGKAIEKGIGKVKGTGATIDDTWYKSSFDSADKSFEYHYKKHVVNEGIIKTKEQYLNDSVKFFSENKNSGITWKLKNGENGIKIKGSDGQGGIYSSDGKPTSFWYK